VEIWIERPLPGAERLTLYALLDSPSVTGAYRIVLRPGEATAADIDLHLYFRRKVRKLGVAPLSSMFLHGELRLRHVEDYRPERHDSDGLLSADGKDTWTWRPLLNPDGTHVVTAQRLDDPVGFGLLQRDRAHTAYLDLEDRYELRPSMWIEARGKWGPGRLELLEIPSAVAHNDNIASYWVPDRTFDAGATLAISYTLSAFADDPNRPPLARAHNTLHERVGDVDRFLIDFVGPQFGDDAANLRADVQSSKGEVRNLVVQPNPANGGVRVSFEVDASTDDAELRASLWRDRRQVSETWVLPWRRQR
jgi:glucans biosynthesis protein